MKAKNEVVTKTAIVPLTETEKLDYGQQAGSMEKMIAEEETKRKDINAKLKEYKTERHRLLTAIEEGEEERTIECEVEMDFENNIVNYLYRGEVVEQRKMEESDRQIKLEEGPKIRRRKKKSEEDEAFTQ
jgi:hypothetical protein